MDPVTGLSRPQLIALGLLVPIGVVASTIATVIGERAPAPCPDQVYGCAIFEANEPVIVALVDATSDRLPLDEVVERGITAGGRTLRYRVRTPGCSVEAAVEDIRDLASDPPDEPPTALVIAAACDAAAIPMAQLLSDSAITLITLGPTAPVPTDPGYHLVAGGPDLEAEGGGAQAVGLEVHLDELVREHLRGVVGDVIEVLDRLAISSEGKVLIPRAALRDALIEAEFERA